MADFIVANIVVVYNAKVRARYNLLHLRRRSLDIVGDYQIHIPIRRRIIIPFQTCSGRNIVVLVKRGVGGYSVEGISSKQRRCLIRTRRDCTRRMCTDKLGANRNDKPEKMNPGHFGGAGLDDA